MTEYVGRVYFNVTDGGYDLVKLLKNRISMSYGATFPNDDSIVIDSVRNEEFVVLVFDFNNHSENPEEFFAKAFESFKVKKNSFVSFFNRNSHAHFVFAISSKGMKELESTGEVTEEGFVTTEYAKSPESDQFLEISKAQPIMKVESLEGKSEEFPESELGVERALTVVLDSCGNPDHGENPLERLPGAGIRSVNVNSLREASEVCRKFIDSNGLGGGNWRGGFVYAPAMPYAYVSYNGRVWKIGDEQFADY